jgi:hypothetical protein
MHAERMWCVQETAVARSVRLFQGSKSVMWDQLISKLTYLEKQKGLGIDVTYALCRDRIWLQETLKNIINPPPNQNSARWPSLSWLLDNTRYRGAQLAHDKVYALWGVLTLMGVKLSPPDYTKPVRSVYQEVTLACFACDRDLDVLYQVTGLPSKHGLPSWVPDLSNTKAPPTLMFEAFHASGSAPIRWQISNSNNELYLSGRVVDRIKRCGDALKSPNEHSSPRDSILGSDTETSTCFEIFKQWLALAEALPGYPTGQSVTEAFGLTLITNSIIRLNRKLPQFINVYASWLELLKTSTSSELFIEKGVDNMLDDVSAIPAEAHQKQEFAYQIASSILVPVIVAPVTMKKKVRAFHHWLHLALRRRLFFVTERGYMGIGPASVSEGDEVVLFSGLKTPFLIRRAQAQGTFRLITPTYIEGIMAGELWNETERLDQFMLV